METVTPNKSMSLFDEAPVRVMNGIMRRKLSLLRDMLNLSEQAGNYIGEDSVESLNNIMDAKQELILEIDRLDKNFLNEFDMLKTNLNISSIEELRTSQSPELADLQSNTSEILGLLNKINALDKKINSSVVKLREDIASDLNRIRRQKQISSLYSGDGSQRSKNESANRPVLSNFDTKK